VSYEIQTVAKILFSHHMPGVFYWGVKPAVLLQAVQSTGTTTRCRLQRDNTKIRHKNTCNRPAEWNDAFAQHTHDFSQQERLYFLCIVCRCVSVFFLWRSKCSNFVFDWSSSNTNDWADDSFSDSLYWMPPRHFPLGSSSSSE